MIESKAPRSRSRIVRAILALAFALSGLLIAPIPAVAANQQRETYAEQFAYFTSQTYDDTGCVSTYVFISTGYNQTYNNIDLSFNKSVYDSCNGSGSYQYGSAKPDVFSFKQQSVHVVGTVQLWDSVTGYGSSIFLDLTFEPSGPATKSSGTSTQMLAGEYFLRNSWRGSFAPAKVTGTFWSTPYTSAYISSSKSTSLSIVLGG